jgi:hypothetical protein
MHHRSIRTPRCKRKINSLIKSDHDRRLPAQKSNHNIIKGVAENMWRLTLKRQKAKSH